MVWRCACVCMCVRCVWVRISVCVVSARVYLHACVYVVEIDGPKTNTRSVYYTRCVRCLTH